MMKLFLLIANGFKPFTQGRRESGAEGRQPPSPFSAANFFPCTIGKHEIFQDISEQDISDKK